MLAAASGSSSPLRCNYQIRKLSRQIGISPGILSEGVQAMELHQLVKRTVCDTRPIMLERARRTLLDVVQTIYDWATGNTRLW